MSRFERLLAIGIVFLVAVKVMSAKQESHATLAMPDHKNMDRIYENAERMHIRHRGFMRAAKRACGANTRTEIAAWEKRNARLLDDARALTQVPLPAKPGGVWRADGRGTHTLICARLARQLVAGAYDLSEDAGAEVSALAREKRTR